MKTKHEGITKAICNKGFRGNSSILPRIKFRLGGQESSLQSATFSYRQPFAFSGENPDSALKQ